MPELKFLTRLYIRYNILEKSYCHYFYQHFCKQKGSGLNSGNDDAICTTPASLPPSVAMELAERQQVNSQVMEESACFDVLLVMRKTSSPFSFLSNPLVLRLTLLNKST
jgi:hypothetical protein